ncbi:unnamed protein product, partial [Oppiella nova]
YETDWSEVSAQVWPQESLIEIQALSPGNWYLLNVKAINEAGSVEQTYQFATLTAQGGTVSPLSEREPLGLESIAIVIPVICSVIVLTVILIIGLIVVNKRRLPATHNPNQSLHNQQNHCRDDQLLGSAYHLSVLDSQPPKDSHENQCFHTTVLNQKQIYFQSPYALSRVDHKMCVPFDGIDSSDDMSVSMAGVQPTREHVYEKPFPPKWVKGTGPQSEEAYGQTLLMDRPTAPQLSVGDVTFDSIEIVWSFPLESPNLTVALATINGYYIYSKSHSSQWMDKQIRQKISSYTAIDLLCGTLYQFYVVAYNAMGKGDPSDAIAIKTKGSAPTSPKHVSELVVANTTSALIRLDGWPSNGCPIKEFVIKYKPSKYETDWSEVSAQVWPQESLI